MGLFTTALSLFPVCYGNSKTLSTTALWLPIIRYLVGDLDLPGTQVVRGYLCLLLALVILLMPVLLVSQICPEENPDLPPNITLTAPLPRGTPRPRLRRTLHYGLKRKVFSRPFLAYRDPCFRPWCWFFSRRNPIPKSHPSRGGFKSTRREKGSCGPESTRRKKCSRPYYQNKKRAAQARQDRLLEKQAEKAPPQEILADQKHKLLHLQAAIYNLDAFMQTIDPLAEFQAMKKVLNPTFLCGTTQADRLTSFKRTAMVAAFKFRLSKDFNTVTELNSTSVTDDYADRIAQMSIYLNHAEDRNIPIVIDTGASVSLSPNKSDFIGPIEACTTSELQGLSSTIKCEGMGWVDWTIRDLYGVTRRLRTRAYYVPDAQIRLFSPQKYFQEHKAGSLLLTWQNSLLTLCDGTQMTFPYNSGNSLPLMLPDSCFAMHVMGSNFEESHFLNDSSQNETILMSVAEETNQNLSNAEKEVLRWHWKLGHANMQHVQQLLVQRDATDGKRTILPTKHKSASSFDASTVKCAACELGKGHLRKPPDPKTRLYPKEKAISAGDLKPGDCVSMDQYQSTVRGRLPHTKGLEPEDSQYCGGTIFCDHASGFLYVRHQTSLNACETISSKRAFERVCGENGVKVKKFRADNHPFGSEAFRKALEEDDQSITFSGVGAHHQNGVAENAVGTTTRWARSMMLHAMIHWPEQSDTKLWAFALDHAVWLWNHIPKRGTLLSPYEIFTGQHYIDYSHLMRSHVWGCPAYVLDPKLQDGKKIPKWNPRSRRGVYLGVSPEHSSTVGRILNLRTRNVSAQYHVVYDDYFSTVPNVENGGKIDPNKVSEALWKEMFTNGIELNVDEDQAPPELHEDWLTDEEIKLRNQRRNLEKSRQINEDHNKRVQFEAQERRRQDVQARAADSPSRIPIREGEVEPSAPTQTNSPPTPLISPIKLRLNLPEPSTAPTGTPTSAPEGASDPEPTSEPEGASASEGEPTRLSESPSREVRNLQDSLSSPVMRGRTRSQTLGERALMVRFRRKPRNKSRKKRPPRNNVKVPIEKLDDFKLQCLNWKQSLDLLRSGKTESIFKASPIYGC